jgi:hypothetical protein
MPITEGGDSHAETPPTEEIPKIPEIPGRNNSRTPAIEGTPTTEDTPTTVKTLGAERISTTTGPQQQQKVKHSINAKTEGQPTNAGTQTREGTQSNCQLCAWNRRGDDNSKTPTTAAFLRKA